MRKGLSSVSLFPLFLLVVAGTGLAQWNGEIVAWGDNNYGQCNVPSPNSGFVAVAGGCYHSLGLREISTSTGDSGHAGIDPTILMIHSIFPNPFDSHTMVCFQSPGLSNMTLTIYDTAGRLVRTKDLGTLPVGAHPLYWDGRDGNGSALASGVYFVRLSSAEQQASTRVVLIR